MCVRTFVCESINAAPMENSKEILMSAKWRASRQGAKKIFGGEIYLFIHLPALYLIAFLNLQVSNREGTKFLELKSNRQIFNQRLFNSRNFACPTFSFRRAFLQTSELNLLNI